MYLIEFLKHSIWDLGFVVCMACCCIGAHRVTALLLPKTWLLIHVMHSLLMLCVEQCYGRYILCFCKFSLIDWISDTRSQGYTDLQSLVKCLDHRDFVSDTACSQAKVVLGCAMH